MNPFIFRKDDIRGIVGSDWSYQDALLIGQAFGTFLRKAGVTKCLLGRDNRLTSEKISQNVALGLIETGVDVIDLGLTTTPMIYWSRYFFGFGKVGSLEVTGSHNPSEYNGLKPCFNDATTLSGDDIQELRRLVDKKAFTTGSGSLRQQDISAEYLKSIKESLAKIDLKPKRKLKMVMDSGNALGGFFAAPLYRILGYEVIELHSRLDGTFPNHIPDPAVGFNLMELIDKVRTSQADIGIAYDGDVDRLNVVDETGYVIWADGILSLLSRYFLNITKNEPILYNTQCSPGLEEDIIAHGGKPVCVPTGHAIVSNYLKRYQGKIAGEYKGHIYIADNYYGFDDAIYAGARILQLLASSPLPLSKMLAGVPYYKATGEIAIPTSDEKKFVTVKKLAEIFKDRYFVADYEGDLRIKFGSELPDTWGMVRKSDTMPKLEVYVWSKTDANLTAARDIIVKEVNQYL